MTLRHVLMSGCLLALLATPLPASSENVQIDPRFNTVTVGDSAGASASPGTHLGYQQLTSLSAASLLTVPTGATSALIVSESQDVRVRDDGVDPTSAVGFPFTVGVPYTVRGNLALLKLIEVNPSATVDVWYFK